MTRRDEVTRIVVCDGKYAVEWGPGQPLHALRYGEEWRDCCGDGLILALAQEIDELRARLSAQAEPGYVAGFEACREAAKQTCNKRADDIMTRAEEAHKKELYDEYEHMECLATEASLCAAAITALPAPATASAGEEVTGWQPIETAPKDASEIIGVYFRPADGMFKETIYGPWTIAFERGKWRSSWDRSEVVEYMSDFGTEYKEPDCEPTHWMPLPAAPTKRSAT